MVEAKAQEENIFVQKNVLINLKRRIENKMVGGNVLKQNYPSAKCEHCGKSTNIGLSHSFRNLIAQNLTKKEEVKFLKMDIDTIHQMKNSQIQSLRKAIKELMDLMTPKQIIKAKLINQFVRDEMRKVEKDVFGKHY